MVILVHGSVEIKRWFFEFDFFRWVYRTARAARKIVFSPKESTTLIKAACKASTEALHLGCYLIPWGFSSCYVWWHYRHKEVCKNTRPIFGGELHQNPRLNPVELVWYSLKQYLRCTYKPKNLVKILAVLNSWSMSALHKPLEKSCTKNIQEEGGPNGYWFTLYVWLLYVNCYDEIYYDEMNNHTYKRNKWCKIKSLNYGIWGGIDFVTLFACLLASSMAVTHDVHSFASCVLSAGNGQLKKMLLANALDSGRAQLFFLATSHIWHIFWN